MQSVWKLIVTVADIEAAEQVLETHGALAQAITPVSPAASSPFSDSHFIEAYFTGQPDAQSLQQALPRHTDFAIEILPDLDWVGESQKGLTPVSVPPLFVHGAHDRDAVPPGRIGLEINAGEAFGTGHHETTTGCLQMMLRQLKSGLPSRAADIGCGTGVLAIALARLTRRPVMAGDIDPIAVRTTAYNARLNHLGGLVKAETGAGFAGPALRQAAPFDLILANILAEPLRQLAPDFRRYLAPGGRLIVSGLLASQERGVVAAMRVQNISLTDRLQIGEWTTLRFRG
ncbi:MAG: 50S ribosomal protein L11 methyltransferase [Parvibaculales bacterium]